MIRFFFIYTYLNIYHRIDIVFEYTYTFYDFVFLCFDYFIFFIFIHIIINSSWFIFERNLCFFFTEERARLKFLSKLAKSSIAGTTHDETAQFLADLAAGGISAGSISSTCGSITVNPLAVEFAALEPTEVPINSLTHKLQTSSCLYLNS